MIFDETINASIKSLVAYINTFKAVLFKFGLFFIMSGTKTILNEDLLDVWAKAAKYSNSCPIKMGEPGRSYFFYYIVNKHMLELINLFVGQKEVEKALGKGFVKIINTLYLIKGYRANDIAKYLGVDNQEIKKTFDQLKELFGAKTCMHLKILLTTNAPEFALSQETLSSLGVKLNDHQINLLRLFYLGFKDKEIVEELKISHNALASRKKALISKLGADDMAHAVSLALGEAYQIAEFDPQRICDLLNQRQTEACLEAARIQGLIESQGQSQTGPRTDVQSLVESLTEVKSPPQRRIRRKSQTRPLGQSPRGAQSRKDARKSQGPGRKKSQNSGKDA
jgi:DNA-binding CsgD family transcriptional regulator